MEKKGGLTKMAPINPHGVRNTGEYTPDMSRGPSAKSTTAKRATASGRMIDGPYGGKKPVS